MLNSFVTSVGQTKTNQVPYELRIRTPASPNCQSGALPTAYKKLLASKAIYQVYIIAYTIWDWIGCTDRWSLLLASCSNKKKIKIKKTQLHSNCDTSIYDRGYIMHYIS